MDQYFEILLKYVAFVILLEHLPIVMENDERLTASTTSKKMSYFLCMIVIIILFPDLYPMLTKVTATIVSGANAASS